MGEYLTNDERLRRIGDLLLKGVYLWAEAAESDAAVVRESAEKPGGSPFISGEASPSGTATYAIRHPNVVRSRPGSDGWEERPSPLNGRAWAPDASGQEARTFNTMTMARTRRPCLPAPGPMEDFAIQFDDVFRTGAQRRGFRTYLQGLLSHPGRAKSLATLTGSTSSSHTHGPSMSCRKKRIRVSTVGPIT